MAKEIRFDKDQTDEMAKLLASLQFYSVGFELDQETETINHHIRPVWIVRVK